MSIYVTVLLKCREYNQFIVQLILNNHFVDKVPEITEFPLHNSPAQNHDGTTYIHVWFQSHS